MLMGMESMRRSLDRSREPGLKKPRLSEDQSDPSGGRLSVQGETPTAAALPPARYRIAGGDRDSEGSDRGGGAYHPQPLQQGSELVSQYKTALAELTFNSKLIINNLTIIAEENVLYAKAIAGTVCNNIIEVPGDQKLPLLYLLDSIVKNIGRDYIKYFAARLPEVFCKAYSQVDPPIHSSMRHLFGTWKGVFPLQTLKMIEKELGFSSSVNGSSASSVTSRADALSQRPQHSIHVNPKYLERQRLQQSGRALISDSLEDIASPVRSSGIVGSHPWTDSAVKIPNIQRSQITPLNDPIEEKSIGPLYGELDYGADASRSSVLGSGRLGARVAELGQPPKPLYGVASGISKKLSDPRNGFRMKNGVPEHLIAKSTKAAHLQPTDSVSRKRSNSTSTSWKNSEEEEFVWDMHSRLPDQDVTNTCDISRKDAWNPSGPEKLGIENRKRRPQIAHDVGSRFDMESSSDSLSTEHKELGNHLSLPWRLQEAISMDELMFSSANTDSSYAVGNPAIHGGLPSMAGSVSRTLAGPHAGASGLGVISNASFIPTTGAMGQQRLPSIGSSSPLQQSLLHQASPSSSFPSRYPPNTQFPNAADHDYSLILPPSRQKVHEFSRNSLPQNVRLGNVNKLQSEELSESSDPPENQIPLLEWSAGDPSTSGSSESEQSIQHTLETPGQPSTSSLLAAVMKSGILSNIAAAGLAKKNVQNSGQVASNSVAKPPLANVPLPTEAESFVLMATSASLKSSTSILSHKKDKQQQLPQVAPPPLIQPSKVGDKVSNPISSLLSSLLVKGLIKSEASPASSSSSQMTIKPENPRKNTVGPKPAPVSSLPEPVPRVNEGNLNKTFVKSPVNLPVQSTPVIRKAKDFVSLPQSTPVETESLIGLKFKSDVIREFHPAVINSLFNDLPHQCDVCGLRLKHKERLDKHLEWHSKKKIGPDGKRWYPQIEHWIFPTASVPSAAVDSSSMDGPKSVLVDQDDDDPMAPADEEQCVCILCGKLFEDYYSLAVDMWMFRGAVHMTPVPSSNGGQGNGPLVHVHCRAEDSASELGLVNRVKMEIDS